MGNLAAGSLVIGLYGGVADVAQPQSLGGGLMLGDTAVQVIDVRSPEAFNNGHIVRAQNMPYGNGMSVRDMINRIDNKRPVAIYCQDGKKSKAAAKRLCRKGVKVYLLDQGIDQWRKERRELMR